MPTALPTGINCRPSSAHVRCHPNDRASTIAMGVALFFVYDVLLGRLMARWPAKV